MKTITTSIRLEALVTGFSLIIMAVAAGIAIGLVQEKLFVLEDPVVTLNNLQTSESLFRFGIFSWLLILICDVFVSWGLYVILKPINSSLSLLTAWLRLIYSSFLGVALLNFVHILWWLKADVSLFNISSDQLAVEIYSSIYSFEQIWSIGLIVFGLHLFGLGYLIVKSEFIPKIIGFLILLAAMGYLVLHTGELLIPGFDSVKSTIELIFIIPMVVGELGFAIWLIVSAFRNKL